MSPHFISFRYVVFRSHLNDRVGISIRLGPQGLCVCDIADAGLVHVKNRRLQDQAPECLEQQLQVDDEILQVNDCRDQGGMRHELRTASEIHMQVKRTTLVDNQMPHMVPLLPPTHTVPPPPPPPPLEDSNRIWIWDRESQTWIAGHEVATLDSNDESGSEALPPPPRSDSLPPLSHPTPPNPLMRPCLTPLLSHDPPPTPRRQSRPPSPPPQPEPTEEVAPTPGVCTWAKYKEPVSQNVVFWKDESGEFFFKEDAMTDEDSPWRAYVDGSNRLWYWNGSSEEWFYEDDAAVAATSPWYPQSGSESDAGLSSPWRDESSSDSDTVHAVLGEQSSDTVTYTASG